MKDVISVDTILVDFYGEQYCGRCEDSHGLFESSKQDMEILQECKTKLHSLLISKLPEKVQAVDIQKPGQPAVDAMMQADAYNEAIDDMRKSIDEMFGVQNEE